MLREVAKRAGVPPVVACPMLACGDMECRVGAGGFAVLALRSVVPRPGLSGCDAFAGAGGVVLGGGRSTLGILAARLSRRLGDVMPRGI